MFSKAKAKAKVFQVKSKLLYDG